MATHKIPPIINRYGLNMRSAFDFSKYNLARWFPGHMAKGYNSIQQKMIGVDCVIEVHDVRIPLSGRNHRLGTNLALAKPHILVFNKVDLIHKKDISLIFDHYEKIGIKNVVFTNCKNHRDVGIRSLIPKVVQLISQSNRYNRSEVNEYCILIIGIPNVGKSSLINAIRAKNLGKGKATKVGAVPGITMSVLERIKISEDPKIYLLDTPGILAPQIESIEVGLKLALANTIKEHLVGEEAIADYLLYKLNYAGNRKYVNYLCLKEPTDDIQQLLTETAIENDLMMQLKRYKIDGGYETFPDVRRAAMKFIHAYRMGEYGTLRIDDNLVPTP